MNKQEAFEEFMKALGWRMEVITITSINLKERRYFKQGNEITEEEALKIAQDYEQEAE